MSILYLSNTYVCRNSNELLQNSSFVSLNLLFQERLLNSAWGMLDNKTKFDLEYKLNCCGLLNVTASRTHFDQDFQSCTAVSLHWYIHLEAEDP